MCRMRVVRSDASVHLELEGREYWFCSLACLERFLREERA
ncbi:MAG: YHS domain-containing protein [Pirellulales bacterium]